MRNLFEIVLKPARHDVDEHLAHLPPNVSKAVDRSTHGMKRITRQKLVGDAVVQNLIFTLQDEKRLVFVLM